MFEHYMSVRHGTFVNRHTGEITSKGHDDPSPKHCGVLISIEARYLLDRCRQKFDKLIEELKLEPCHVRVSSNLKPLCDAWSPHKLKCSFKDDMPDDCVEVAFENIIVGRLYVLEISETSLRDYLKAS